MFLVSLIFDLSSSPSLIFNFFTSIAYTSCPTWQLPHGRNMYKESNMINLAWQSSGKPSKEHAIQIERDKVSTPTLPTNTNSTPLPQKLICLIVFLWEFDIRTSRFCHIRHFYGSSGTWYDSSSPDVCELCFSKRKVYSWGLRNLWIQTDLWLIRPWIQRCPWTSREDSLSSPKTDFFSGVGDLSWSPDRLALGLKVPVLHFTQHCVLIFFELDKVMWILKGLRQDSQHSDILDEGSYEKMTSCHSIHLKSFKTSNIEIIWAVKTFAMESLERFSLLHHILQGNFTDWVPIRHLCVK